MKARIAMFLAAAMAVVCAYADTEIVDGITWTYTVANGVASVGGGSRNLTAIPTSTYGAITIPSTLGGYTVTSIGDYAFNGCSGLTSVSIVTEIKGGAVAVAESWAENYPSFTEKFGNDFAAALTKPSGKRDSQGNALMVWQDYVAGTDPTDENDIFKASVTLVDGVPHVSYTPELSEAEKAKRKYTTYGKARLQDTEWSVVDDDADKYNFFKVTVEMR